jgi:hypothetical protein
VLQLVMSALLVLAGLYLALGAGTAGDMRFFGWVLALLGAVGVAGSLLLRRRRGGTGRP